MEEHLQLLLDIAQKAYYAELDRRDKILTSLRLSSGATALLVSATAFIYIEAEKFSPTAYFPANLKTVIIVLLGMSLLFLAAAVLNFLKTLFDSEIKVISPKIIQESGLAMLHEGAAKDTVVAARIAFLSHACTEYGDAAEQNCKINDSAVEQRRTGFEMMTFGVTLVFFSLIFLLALRSGQAYG